MTHTFYQSDIRREINQSVYQKPLFECSFLGEQYFGTIKTQKRLGKELRWYMVQGVEGIDGERKSSMFVDELEHIKRDYGKSRGDIFFQVGIIQEHGTYETLFTKKDKEFQQQCLVNKGLQDERMRVDYGLVPSWREHMPDTTIILDLSSGIQATRSGYSKSCKRYINKAKKEDLSFVEGEKGDIESFRHVWYTMSYDKGFSVVSRETFVSLMDYLISSGNGLLLLAKKGKKIVAGSVVIQRGKKLIYLYGATDRSFGAIGGHYWLTDQIMKRGADHGYVSYDLLGTAPVGNDHHYLSGVTRFKQSFGGSTILSVGNYDLVFNSLLYRTFQFVKTRKLGKKVVKEDIVPQKAPLPTK